MKDLLKKDIDKQALELKKRFEVYHNYLHLWHERKEKIFNNMPPKKIKVPNEWAIDKKYNPFYVLKKSDKIANSITRRILSGTYEPQKPYLKKIPKPSGNGDREISIYQIPDSAVSYRIYKNLLSKNKHRFSSLTYAYRNDRNIHYAIQDIAHEINSQSRIFVAEFDFTDFFGSIDHGYLYQQLSENAFLISNSELKVIKAFLKDRGGKGIPLGTSISLFLANVVCWKLDRKLEDEGVRFARYADDTIIWSKDYSKISKSFEIISDFSRESGIKINFNKSDGISLLKNKDLSSEFFNSKEHVEFLGYSISTDKISIKCSSVQRIKKHISFLLYNNLLKPLKTPPISEYNFPLDGKDKNLLSVIMEIRRYLYGNLTEITLKKYLNGTYKILSFKGLMSFYPLINDTEQLKSLDNWLISTILNAMELRKKILIKYKVPINPKKFPFEQSKDEFISTCKTTVVNGKKGLLEIPSFMRIHNALKLGLINEGIDRVMNPKSGYYR